jgi:hypothetical protein
MQPDPAPKKGGFFERLGSTRRPYVFPGRTQFQSRMAATISDRPTQGIQRSMSARTAGSMEGVPVQQQQRRQNQPADSLKRESVVVEPSTPLKYMDSGLTDVCSDLVGI